MNKITHFVYYKCSKILTITNSTAMYTSNERAASYPVPVRPDFTSDRTKTARFVRQLLTVCLGHDFMELSMKQKAVGLYLIISLMAPVILCSENHPWLSILLVGNMANAVRLANRLIRKTSARD